MRASRLLSILILLQMRGRVSATALAAEFEVSVRTIHRDIDQLSAAGIPVYAERGRAGGFALAGGYRTRLTGFTPHEAEALLLAGAPSVADDLGFGPEQAAAQLKLLASLPADAGASADRVASRFHLDPANWYSRAEPPDTLKPLAQAVWAEQRIEIVYESWRDVVTRALDPLGLVLKGGAWYLVAAARAKPRTYRVDAIRQLKVLDAPAKRPARFDLARYWRAWASEFETRMLNEKAHVRLSPEGLRRLHEVSPAAGRAAAASTLSETPDGWIEADIPVEGVVHTTRQILSLGAEVEVLAPLHLRQAVAAEAARLLTRYAEMR